MVAEPLTEIKKEDPEIKKEDSEIKKDDTEIKKDVTEIKKEDPEIKKEDAEIKKEEPANAEEMVQVSTDSATGSVEVKAEQDTYIPDVKSEKTVDNDEASGLTKRIIRQIEYYFGNYNLTRDKFLKEQLEKDDGWVPLEVLIRFNRLKQLTDDFKVIIDALGKSPNKLMEISDDGLKVRRRSDIPIPDASLFTREKVDERTLYMKGFKKDATLEEISEFFNDYNVDAVFMRKYKHGNVEGFKGSCFVAFTTLEDSEKFLQTKGVKFNRVELLKEKKCDYMMRKEKEFLDRKAKVKKTDKGQSPSELPELNVVSGCLLKITGLTADISREQIKESLESFGSVAYIEYYKGQDTAIVRFDSGAASSIVKSAEEIDGVKKLDIASSKFPVSTLNDEEEKEYYVRANQHRRSRRQAIHYSKTKGRFRKNDKKNYKRRHNDDDTEQPSKKRKSANGNVAAQSEAPTETGKAEKMDVKESNAKEVEAKA